LPAACLKLLRFQPVPYTLHGKLILKPVDGATDLLWTGADNPQAAQCPALRALIDHCWFKFRLVGAAASALKIRKVDRETRWRWRLKVLWTAACILRKR